MSEGVPAFSLACITNNNQLTAELVRNTTELVWQNRGVKSQDTLAIRKTCCELRYPTPGGHAAINGDGSRKKVELSLKSPCRCSVCEEVIVESDKATKVEGQDAVLCEGPCQGWLHRRCAGLSKSAFKSVSNSTDPFYCPYCRLKAYEAQLLDLKSTLCAVTAELSKLKNKFSSMLVAHPVVLRAPPLFPSYCQFPKLKHRHTLHMIKKNII